MIRRLVRLPLELAPAAMSPPVIGVGTALVLGAFVDARSEAATRRFIRTFVLPAILADPPPPERVRR
jgi:hypothetical protein